jgi:sugar phosphate isomerase/epimerase
VSTGPLPRPVALQMYTLRDLDLDYPRVLELVAGIGFAGVETAGLHGLSAEEVRRILDDLGMQACSAHIPLPDGEDAKAALEEVRTIGAPAIFPSLREEWFTDADAVARAADRFAAAVPVATEAGIELGYHNHWWEFSNRFGGRTAYEAFLDALRQRDVPVVLEVDVYWAQVGGVDPAELVASLGSAVRSLHVKDGPARGRDDQMTAIGTGSVDLPAVLSANDAVRWHIVELDRCATDMVEAVRQSYRHLVEGGFSTGRASTGAA